MNETGLPDILPEEAGWSYGSILPFRTPGMQGAPGTGLVSALEAGKPVQWALPGFLRGAINDVGLMLQAPHAAAEGQLSTAQMAQIAPRFAMGMGLVGAGVPVPEGALRVFGGLESPMADAGKYLKAVDMEKELGEGKEAAQKIWNETGWLRGKDGKWRFEIPDTGARANMEKIKEATMNAPSPEGQPSAPVGRLGDYMQHEKLYAAYPGLENLPVGTVDFPGVRGGYDYDKQMMYLGKELKPEEALSTMLHESQHAVQHAEGFARGANYQQFLPDDFEEHATAVNAQIPLWRKFIRDVGENVGRVGIAGQKIANGVPVDKLPPNFRDAWQSFAEKAGPHMTDRLLDHFRDIGRLGKMEEDAHNKYLMSAGEVEARNVQERLAQGDYSTFPHATEGYPQGEQNVQFYSDRPKTILTPVDHDPFTQGLVPVEHDPFEEKK